MALNETQPDILTSGLITVSLPTLEDGVNFLLPCLHGRVSTHIFAEYHIEPLSIITAGSVVSKNTNPNMVYAGNPAQAVKVRNIRAC